MLVAIVGAVVVGMNLRRFSLSGRKAVWFCFWAHAVGVYVHIWVTANMLGGGDLFMYEETGRILADLLSMNFQGYFEEAIRLYFQEESAFIPGLRSGSSTASQQVFTGVLIFFTGGSFHAASMVVSLMAFSGQVAIYLALRDVIHRQYHKRLQIACLLVPSVLFWSAAVQKEALALAGMGWIFLALMRLVYGKLSFLHVVMAIAGGILVAHSKAYILIALVAGGAAAFYWRRSQSTPGENALVTKPLYLVVALIVALVGMIGLGELFPRFSIQNFAEEAAALQTAGQRVSGGSNIMLVEPEQAVELGFVGQLTFAPVAIFTSLFRPLIVEAHNFVALVNALETTAILVVFIKIMWARPWRRSLTMVMNSPPLIFCLVMTMILALGVGLTTTNLGTLSRYRLPMMPFYITILLLLWPMKTGSSQGRTGHRRS